jgi:hypothetical protein
VPRVSRAPEAPLQRAQADQPGQTGCRGTGQGGGGVDRRTRQRDRPAADAVAQRAGGDLPQRIDRDIGQHAELHAVRRRGEIGGDGGQCGQEGGGGELHRRGQQHQQPERHAASGRDIRRPRLQPDRVTHPAPSDARPSRRAGSDHAGVRPGKSHEPCMKCV